MKCIKPSHPLFKRTYKRIRHWQKRLENQIDFSKLRFFIADTGEWAGFVRERGEFGYDIVLGHNVIEDGIEYFDWCMLHELGHIITNSLYKHNVKFEKKVICEYKAEQYCYSMIPKSQRNRYLTHLAMTINDVKFKKEFRLYYVAFTMLFNDIILKNQKWN